jgi:hypothetical protein
MGDRGNIIVKQHSEEVYLYSHWHGHDLPEILQTALKRKQRWDDNQYLARIIFCTMVKGNEAGETGFGISSKQHDGGVDIVVDVPTQTVKYDDKSYSFNDYIELENPNEEFFS